MGLSEWHSVNQSADLSERLNPYLIRKRIMHQDRILALRRR